ncbi:uncharacterized protein LOC123631793 isoform X2 [Lemur catta]|uniref:uncharacterized protein LOC123631793 isoform X2 n=1 Tax=Lemur catta TaxID=9447 RepID=UPI001E26675C|nr:uncharacterized protein LOC123631793 isoform X2 [Lemur catta]
MPGWLFHFPCTASPAALHGAWDTEGAQENVLNRVENSALPKHHHHQHRQHQQTLWSTRNGSNDRLGEGIWLEGRVPGSKVKEWNSDCWMAGFRIQRRGHGSRMPPPES